jgi:hypothetical protein
MRGRMQPYWPALTRAYQSRWQTVRMSSSLRRILASLLAWSAGAVVAVSVGVLALSAIGDGWASGAPQPLRPDGAGQLGAAAPTGPASPAAAGSPTGSGQTRTVPAHGGTVNARCAGGQVYLISWSPAQGYQVDEVHRGPGRVASVLFKAAHREWVLRVHCVGGIPEADAGSTGDDRGGND